MTADERRFLELELESLLRKLRRNQERVPIDRLKTEYRNGYEALLSQIREKAAAYLKVAIFTGMDGYYLRDELPEMVEMLNRLVNAPEARKPLQQALFKEPDMERVRCLAAGLHTKAEPIVREYQAHAMKGE